MSGTLRRYDIDWLRVVAIGFLLIYHVAIGFQSWGVMIGFITNKESWGSLWVPMTMLNVWRIPLLFFVSGMGVFFAIRKRNWKQLLLERTSRIFLPYVFGIFCVFPISMYILRDYYQWDQVYAPHPGHLWFLGNIFAYVVLLMPLFFYLKNNEEGRLATWIKKIFSTPFGFLLVVAACTAEAMILDPKPYELYSMTWHGFFLGLLAFIFGFCFVLSGQPFWSMVLKGRWVFFAMAVILFTFRVIYFKINVPAYLLVTESDSWIFTLFGFGYKYLNRPGKTLRYLSQAAYPIYIIHMIFLYLGSYLIFPLDLHVVVKFFLVLVFTFIGSFALYDLVIRRVPFLRPLFGLKLKKENLTSLKKESGVLV